MLLVIIVQVIFAVLLFFIVNLLGQHTPSNLGYYQLSTFLETQEPLAFNFLIRVLTPIVYIILLSAIFYALKLDQYTTNIYLLSVYYVAFRTLFNLAINRTLLINWIKYFIYSASIVLISYFVYDKLIKTKTNLLPDFSNMANELWVVIIIFLYSVINNISLSDTKAQSRKNNYVKQRYQSFTNRYAKIVDENITQDRLKQILYAIMIYEDFNRPKLFRLLEYISFGWSSKPHTLGIMQMMTSKKINDEESVRLAAQKLTSNVLKLKAEYDYDKTDHYNEEFKDINYQYRLISDYNNGVGYTSEVINLADQLNDFFFADGSKSLFKN